MFRRVSSSVAFSAQGRYAHAPDRGLARRGRGVDLVSPARALQHIDHVELPNESPRVSLRGLKVFGVGMIAV